MLLVIFIIFFFSFCIKGYKFYDDAVDLPTIQNMKLTINHDKPITASQIAACFNTFVHDFTFQSSHAAVSIWNHPRRQSTRATNDNIHSIRFMVL